MNDQPDLFSWQSPADPRTLAHRHDPITSHEAAKAIVSRVTQLQAEVMAYAEKIGAAGFTDYELARDLGGAYSTYRTRRGEMVRKGKIENSGRTKHHGTVRRHTIWRVVQPK